MIQALKTCFACVALILAPALAAAQGTTGSISGSVVDESKSVLPGVTITVTNVGTGLERVQVSDTDGRYRVLDLPPGQYTVKAEISGFAPVLRSDLTVAIGRDLLADIEMKVRGVTEQVTVVGESSNVSLGNTTAGGVVTTQQIAELPLNGRSYMQLATLQPGVIISRATARDFTGGFGTTQLSIGGARPEQTGYLMDGTNIADISDKAPSSLSGLLLGVDTVQEFSVQTHGYNAEFGRAAGGVMSTVTKSGTNRIRGSVFEFHRDETLDSKNFFATGDLPDFQRDQYGGTVGGPILPNKLFYFGAYEALRERNAVTRFARLPNAAAHQGILPTGTVPVHATTRPYLDLLFPIPNGQDFGDGTAELEHSHQDPTDEHFGVVKFDYNIGKGGSTLMVRWSRDVSDTNISQGHPLFFEQVGTETRYFTTQLQSLFGSGLMNTVRFAANRTGRDNDLIPTVEIPTSLYFSEDPHFGAISITNISTAGSVATIPVDYKQDLYQLSDTVTWMKGDHVVKGGFNWENYHFDGFSYSRYGGEFRFRTLVGIPAAEPKRHLPGRPVHGQPARHGHVPPDAAELFRDVRAGRLARDEQPQREPRSALGIRDGSNGKERANRRPSEPRRSRAGAVWRHRGHADVRQPVEEEHRPSPGRRVEPARRQANDRQGRLRDLLPAADDVVLPWHDLPHLPVLRGRRHPAADRVRPRQHRGARGRDQSRARAEAVGVHFL